METAFALPGAWYRGNLHGHTTESDGTLTPEAYVAAYRRLGYDFVAATDHWRVTDLAAYAAPDLAWVPGVEVDGRDAAGSVYHVLALGVQEVPPRAAAADLPGLVRAVRELGGLPFAAHPYWSGQTGAELAAVPGLAGLEVFNGTCEVRWGKGVARVQWDEALAAGARLLGLATDDAHHRVEVGDDLGLGWVWVRARENRAPALLEALASGAFYASTGPALYDFEVAPRGPGGRPVARVRCSPCRAVRFLCERALGGTVRAPEGRLLTEAEFPLHPAARLVRVECVDARGRVAWSQPLWTG
jgi:hypothetical protein